MRRWRIGYADRRAATCLHRIDCDYLGHDTKLFASLTLLVSGSAHHKFVSFHRDRDRRIPSSPFHNAFINAITLHAPASARTRPPGFSSQS